MSLLTVVHAALDAVDDGGSVSRVNADVERLFERHRVHVHRVVQVSRVDWHL